MDNCLALVYFLEPRREVRTATVYLGMEVLAPTDVARRKIGRHQLCGLLSWYWVEIFLRDLKEACLIVVEVLVVKFQLIRNILNIYAHSPLSRAKRRYNGVQVISPLQQLTSQVVPCKIRFGL